MTPGIDPCTQVEGPGLFGDDAEYTFANTIGWFFLVTGLFGLACAWRTRILPIFAPSFLLLILCLVYHPTSLPTLRVFPWHGYARVSSRATMIYPTLFALFSLGMPRRLTSSWTGRFALVSGGALLALEMWVAYGGSLTAPQKYLRPGDDFFRFMQTVRESSGEAVLEWPFQIYAGNAEVWPFEAYEQLNNAYSYRQFHQKKIVGMYFGRIHPCQVEPFYEAGWDKLFSPGIPSRASGYTSGQTRNFAPDKWEFFTETYQLNDFCGIILYPNLLTTECVREFHERFGLPVCTVSDGIPTMMEFIPKKPEWRRLVDREKARAISFVPLYLPGDRIDCAQPSRYFHRGWHTGEPEFRWTERVASIRFRLSRPQALLLRFRAYTLDGQRVFVRLNHKPVGTLDTSAGLIRTYELPLPAHLAQEKNLLAFEVPEATKPASRELGLAVSWIELLAVDQETKND